MKKFSHDPHISGSSMRQITKSKEVDDIGERRYKGGIFSWVIVVAIASCLAAIFTGWSAWEMRQSAIEAGKVNRAGVWLQLLTEYADPQMVAAMKSLRGWQQNDPQNFADDFRNLLLKKNRSAKEDSILFSLDANRRKVVTFYNKVRVLSDAGVIDEKLVSASWSSGTYTYISTVLIPIQHAKSDALFLQGGHTDEDMKVSEELQEKMLVFYKRIAQQSKEMNLQN